MSLRLFQATWYILLLPIILPHTISAFGPKKYQEWFPGWREGYDVVDMCAEQVGTYWADSGTFPWKCQAALDCIIGNTSGSALQEMSSSLVLLGMTPTMLSQLGPKLSESAMLSYQRLGLSFLLSMGVPTVCPGRIFSYESPFGTLKIVVEDQPLLRRVSSTKPFRQMLIIILEYALALGAICNIVYLSIDLSWRSVLSWACTTNWIPLAWVLFPGSIHLIGAVAFHIIPKSVKAHHHSSKSTMKRQRLGALWKSFNEFRTCYGQGKKMIIVEPPGYTTVCLNNFAQLLVVFHILIGTIIFSSCQFLRFIDAVPVITRYAISTLVCRFIYVYELRGMSAELGVEQVERASLGH